MQYYNAPMLISESHRFVFVHVQKTAGTSLATRLVPYAMQPSASRWNRVASDLGLIGDWRRFHYRKHAPLRLAERLLPAEQLQDFFSFGFVRNPWDRMVSWYHYILSRADHQQHDRVQRLGDFEAFVREFSRKPRRSQWWMLANRRDEIGVQFVGRYEHLQRDVESICARIGVATQPMPHFNQVQRAPYQTYFTPAARRFVAEHAAREIEAFGYVFDDDAASPHPTP